MDARSSALAGLCVLVALPASAGQLSLSWIDTAATEQGFKIERCQVIAPATTCAAFVQIATTPAQPGTDGVAGYVSAGLAVGTRWCYRVRAYQGTVNTAYSNIACGTVVAPFTEPPPDALNVD